MRCRCLCLLALCLASCAAETRLVYRPRPNWQRSQSGTASTYRPDPRNYKGFVPEGAEFNSPPAHTSDHSEVTFAGMIEARQRIADVARAHGMELRASTEGESLAGWNEIYAGPKGDGEVRVRENVKGNQLDIAVREPGKNATVAKDIRYELGIPPG